jgi:2-methylcitrate dehydratase PrpD
MLTEQLARFVVSTPLADIPNEALLRAQDALIDTLGVGIAGTLESASEIAQAWAQERGGNAHPQSYRAPLNG